MAAEGGYELPPETGWNDDDIGGNSFAEADGDQFAEAGGEVDNTEADHHSNAAEDVSEASVVLSSEPYRHTYEAMVSMVAPDSAASQPCVTRLEIAALETGMQPSELQGSGAVVRASRVEGIEDIEDAESEFTDVELLQSFQQLLREGELLRLPDAACSEAELSKLSTAVGELGLRVSAGELRDFVGHQLPVLSAGAMEAAEAGSSDATLCKQFTYELERQNERLQYKMSQVNKFHQTRKDQRTYIHSDHLSEVKSTAKKYAIDKKLLASLKDTEKTAPQETAVVQNEGIASVRFIIEDVAHYPSYFRLLIRFNYRDDAKDMQLWRMASLTFSIDNLRKDAKPRPDPFTTTGTVN